MTPAADEPLIAAFLDLIVTGRLDDAARLAERQIEAGVRPQDVVRGLLVPVQAEVGDRWHRAAAAVVDEHRATAVVDAALHRVVAVVTPRPYRATLAVLCAPGDWHLLACRMAAELLRIEGWEVLFLGASLPAPDLGSWLRRVRPDAVVVSCSMPTFGRGVLATATAAADCGIPVVAGGLGLGRDGWRAAALGVGWAADVSDLSATLAVPTLPVDHDDMVARLVASNGAALRRSEVVDEAMEELRRMWPQLPALSSRQLARTADNLGHLIDFGAAAILMNDNRVLTEFVDWLTVYLDARGAPPEAVALSLRALTIATSAHGDAVHTLLASSSESTPGWNTPDRPAVARPS